jgi:hypothetical protein
VGEAQELVVLVVIVGKRWHGGDGHAGEIVDSELVVLLNGKGDGRGIV